MEENNFERVVSNPTQELEHFKGILEKKSFSTFGDKFERLDDIRQDQAVEKTLLEHVETLPKLTTQAYSSQEEKAEEIVLALLPEEDDVVMEELLGLVQERGIVNTINAIEKTKDFHIKDDFHRFLVQYIKSGYEVNLKETSDIYAGLHMTLFEVSLPGESGTQDKEKTLELLLSSMEQFYAGMFSVSENGKRSDNYYSIEIAYPQGREEVVFFCAIPDQKKNVFKNQVLAIFPNASISENTNDYNIFNKKKHVAFSEASLTKPIALPLKTYKDLNYDPLNIILQSFTNLEKSEGAAIQIMLSPDSQSRNEKMLSVLDDLSKGKHIDDVTSLSENSFMGKVVDGIDLLISSVSKKDESKIEIEDTEKRQVVSEQVKLKNTSRFYKANIRLVSAGNTTPHAEAILSEIESSFYQFENPVGNSFSFLRIQGSAIEKKIRDYTFRVFDYKEAFSLNTSELTSIFHFPESSLNAGDILSTSSFSSAGVSKKIMDNAFVETKSDYKVQKTQSIPQEVNQENQDIPYTRYSEPLPQEDVSEYHSPAPEETRVSDFVFERPDESWTKGGRSFDFSQLQTRRKIIQEPIEKPHRPIPDEITMTPQMTQKDPLEVLIQKKKDQMQQALSEGVQETTVESKNSSQENLGDASFNVSKNILLGYNAHQGIHTDIYMKAIDRMRHMYVIGKSGVGKTNILKNMIVQDINNGDGCCFIDPHGSDIEDILAQIPPERHDDVIYFDPTNINKPMGMNMLEYDPAYPEQKTFVVDELFGIFKKLYSGTPESMGPAFEQYFRNATLLVLEHPESGCTMIEISRVLSDEAFRKMKLSHCKNMIVKQFWEKIAGEAGGDAELANIVPYITNKFDVFLANDFMRPIIAQEKSAFNFRDIMDNKKILLVNLSKGKLGELNSNLIGLILVGKILMSALSRVDSLDQNLPPFYLYIDEFQNVTTDSISQILSEARKYKLSLNIAHQYIKQIDEKIRDAVFGNVGSMAVFRVGPEDAEFLEKQFAPTFTSKDILNLNNYNAYLKLLVDGEPQKPFNIITYPPQVGNLEVKDYLKQVGAQKYGRDREVVEREVNIKFSSLL